MSDRIRSVGDCNKCGGLCVEELMKLNDILLTLCVMVMTLFGGVSCVRDGNAATSSVTHSEQDSISMNMKEMFGAPKAPSGKENLFHIHRN